MVMNVGFSSKQMKAVKKAYESAIEAGFDKSLYMFSNVEEFWANGSQAWFHAITRTDVNAGITTRELVKSKLPRLAKLMTEVYGDSVWTYSDTCPRLRGQRPVFSSPI